MLTKDDAAARPVDPVCGRPVVPQTARFAVIAAPGIHFLCSWACAVRLRRRLQRSGQAQ